MCALSRNDALFEVCLQLENRMRKHPIFSIFKFVGVAEAAFGCRLDEEDVLVRLLQADDSDIRPVVPTGIADEVLVRGDRVTLLVGDAEVQVITQGIRMRPTQVERGWQIIAKDHIYEVLHVDNSKPGEIIITAQEVNH